MQVNAREYDRGYSEGRDAARERAPKRFRWHGPVLVRADGKPVPQDDPRAYALGYLDGYSDEKEFQDML